MSDLRLSVVLTFLLVTCQLFAQSVAEIDGYEVVRQDEKITMYERWVPYPGTTTSSRQIKCIFHANVELTSMFAHLYEEEKLKTWQENILEYIITPKNDSVWVAYSYYRIPWPLNNQDYLLTYAVQKKKDRLTLSFTHLEDEKLGAIRKGVDRRPTIGKWELEKVSTGKTKITYTITSLPLSTPRFITDRIVHNSLMSTIHKLITVAEK
ncbi:MAG TPA: hypothetical protein VFU05_09675 [Cyclobacteriaceae bacterium]|nr:hypothetical protein [Cyclobacteriaceae bacterium]